LLLPLLVLVLVELLLRARAALFVM